MGDGLVCEGGEWDLVGQCLGFSGRYMEAR